MTLTKLLRLDEYEAGLYQRDAQFRSICRLQAFAGVLLVCAVAVFALSILNAFGQA